MCGFCHQTRVTSPLTSPVEARVELGRERVMGASLRSGGRRDESGSDEQWDVVAHGEPLRLAAAS